MPAGWASPDAPAVYELRLYVSGASAASARAVVNTRNLCEAHLKGRYTLEIFNIADAVEKATLDQIVAAPTLIKCRPLPLRRFVGDMSNTEHLLRGLDLSPPA